MSKTFHNFYDSVSDLIKEYEKKSVQIKIEDDLDAGIIKIFGENITSVNRAKNGLNDVSELAYSTAEHHPYWGFLFHCSQISKTILEKWDEKITAEELDEIDWSINELKNVCTKLKNEKNE